MASSTVVVGDNNMMRIENKVDPRDDKRVTPMTIIPIPLDQLPPDYCKSSHLVIPWSTNKSLYDTYRIGR